MTTVLLGPQRFRQTAGTVASALAPEGRIATVTAGWQEREIEDAELADVMGGRSQNLGLFGRLGHVIRHDATFAKAAGAYNRHIDEAHKLYVVRLRHAMDAVYATLRRTVREDLRDSALRAGVQAVRDVDSWYLWLLSELDGELWSDGRVDESDIIAAHRGEVAEMIAESALLAVAGGHVGFLGRCLRLFEVFPPEELPVIGWSAGAMVLTQHIVLYHDNGPEGVQPAEVWDRGVARVSGVVAMPHARRRLQLDDQHRNEVLAHRFAPARVLLLDDGVQVTLGPDGSLPGEARVITSDGAISTLDDERARPDGPPQPVATPGAAQSAKSANSAKGGTG